MDDLDKVTITGITGSILLSFIIFILNKFINSFLVYAVISGFIIFWFFYIMLKQIESIVDKTGWSDKE